MTLYGFYCPYFSQEVNEILSEVQARIQDFEMAGEFL